MTCPRPQLAAVLAALTDTPEAMWHLYGNEFVQVTTIGAVRRTADVVLNGTPLPGPSALWTYPDPAEAYEVLQTRGLIPADYRGKFACGQCGGTSRIVIQNDLNDYFAVACHACPGPLSRPYAHPQTLPDLVAWASLGFAPSDDGKVTGILAAEELAARCRRGVHVLWRAMAPRTPKMRGYFVGGFDMALDADMNIAVLSAPPL